MIPSFVFLKKVKTKFLAAASTGKRKISPMCEFYSEVAGHKAIHQFLRAFVISKLQAKASPDQLLI